VGFRDRLKYLVFKAPEQDAGSGDAVPPPVLLDQIARPPVSLTTPVAQIPAPQGEVDFQTVFRAAGIVVDNPFATAEKAMELRQNFSALPPATQVESVEAALKTFGIAEPRIVADAVSKGEAIEAYLEGIQRETKASADQSNAEIAALTAQIEEKRKKLQERIAFQEAVNRRCQEEMERYAGLVAFLASDDPK
jgi:hypothetical protein